MRLNKARMRDLVRLMGELENQLTVCTRCGTCIAVCPVVEQTGRESDVARGKLALLDGLLLKILKDPEKIYRRIEKCLLCGACAEKCPSGVNILEIFFKARVIITGFTGLSRLKKIIFKLMSQTPSSLDLLTSAGVKFAEYFSKPVNETLSTSCMRFATDISKTRNFRLPDPVPFHKSLPSLNTYSDQSEIRAGFFVGCIIDRIFPNIASAVIKTLKFHKTGIFLPEGQVCCGIPALASGDGETFKKLVRRNLEIFEDAEFTFLVTACATCTFTIKKLWPLIMKNTDDEIRVTKIAKKVIDINRFLISEVKIKPGQTSNKQKVASITYHDPCHLKKSLGVYAEPRDLIRANPSYSFIEMPDSDKCCGMGGSFNLQYYEISKKIGMEKLNNIKTSGCSAIASGCPACMLQISDMLSRSNDNIIVKHPVEIYAESLGFAQK